MKIGKVAKICIYPTLIRFPPLSAPFIKYIVVPFKDATIIILRPEIISKGDLEELFPWPPGFYESVTRKTEHTVPEVNHHHHHHHHHHLHHHHHHHHHHYHWLNLSFFQSDSLHPAVTFLTTFKQFYCLCDAFTKFGIFEWKSFSVPCSSEGGWIWWNHCWETRNWKDGNQKQGEYSLQKVNFFFL